MAKETNIADRVYNLIKPVVDTNGFELVDVEYVKEGPNWYLRIYIDKEEGISIDDCELISKSVDTIIDGSDPIEQAYILEVSSPGIDRPLKSEEDFIRYKGELVDIKLYKPINKKKEYQCYLISLEDGIVTATDEDGQKIEFIKKDIASIRLAVIF